MTNAYRIVGLLTIGTLLFGVRPAPVEEIRNPELVRAQSVIHNLVESNWQLQDETRMREIREPGLVRFVEGEVNWGGIISDNAVSVPKQAAPMLDGRLDEPCWQKAAAIAAANVNEPAFRLYHDGQRLYVGVSLPTTAEPRFSGDVTAADAAGAVDGVKNGLYAFHTGGDPNPWWQVDLGMVGNGLRAVPEIAKIVIYNRLDYAPGLHNADNLIILTSDDEQNWTVRHENKGKHFGGVGGGGPLVVNFPQSVKARFVRVQLPGNVPILFHLDEVEVYDASNNNIALRKPAKQSSLSIWSRGGLMGSALLDFGGMKVNLTAPGGVVALNGKPYEQGSVFRADGRTMMEVALPLRVGGGFPGRIALTGDRAFPLMLSGDWTLRVADEQSLGFGRNRLKIDLQTTERRAHLPIERRAQNAVGRERTLCRSSDDEDSMSEVICTVVAERSDIESSRSEERHRVRSLPATEISVQRFDPPIELTVETVVFTPQRAERRSVQKSVSEPGATFVEFDIAHEGAAAVFLTARQGEAMVRQTRTFFVHPVSETLERARRLMKDFGGTAQRPFPTDGTARSPFPTLWQRAEELAERERTNGADTAARAALYREARWLAREIAFQNPLLPEKLVFVKRFTQQTYPDVCLNHMPWVSRPGGDICVLSPLRPDGEVRPLLNGKLGPGHVHGMDLWWDANRVVFGYAKAKSNEPPVGWLDRATSYNLRRSEEPTHIFEIGVDGTHLRQLTKGEWSDLDPTYLPNGDVAFVSERCGFSLQCNELDKDETSCNLYVMKPDGSKIRRMSVTKDGDYLPHTLDNGLVAYTRWEYHERNWANIQSIWTIRPDGTGADALFKQHLNDPWALEDSRSIPHSQKLISIATGHHTLAAGPVVIINPSVGINNPDGIGIVTPGVVPPEGGMSGKVVPEGGVRGKGGHYMTPWALSDKHFLASYTYGGMTDEKGYALYLMDVYGTRELIYRDPNISCSVPIPLQPRKRPPILPSLLPPSPEALGEGKGVRGSRERTPCRSATCVVTNVHEGVEGVKPGTIRYIRISEPLGWPYDNVHGGQRYEPDVKSVMLNWNPVRVIGTVPVEADGSAHFTVPADTELSFQALDKNYMEIVRMRSFISFQPGEVRGCTGCHETRAHAPQIHGQWLMVNGQWSKKTSTINHQPSTINHASLALRRKPSVPSPPSWGSDRALSFLRDVQPVLDRHCVKCHSGLKPAGGFDFSGGLTEKYNRAFETILNAGLVARSNIGDDAKITKPLMFGSHKSKIIKTLGAGCHKTVKLSGDDWLRLVTWVDANAPYHGGFINKRTKTQPYDLASDRELLKKIADVHARRCASCHEVNTVTRSDWIDLRDPLRSLFLTAPLSKESGGTAKCGQPVYRDRSDADYQTVRQAVTTAVRQAWERPRRDVATLARPAVKSVGAARPFPTTDSPLNLR